MNNKLTEKQELVLEILKSFISKKGYSPTLRELIDLLGEKGVRLSCLNSLVQYLKVLEEKRYIQRFSKARGIRLLDNDIENFVEIPLVGNANCGQALCFADNHIEEYINISKKFIRKDKEDYFFVKAVGDSMDKEHINDSDYVLVRKTQDVKNGDNILAVINGLGTIKKIKKENNASALFPSSTNPKHQPIFLHPDDEAFICGKVEKAFNFSATENN